MRNPLFLLVASLTFLSFSSSQSNLTSSDASQSLFWGTWRPNLYFGMKPRNPNGLNMGLIWFSAAGIRGGPRFRHSCEQSDSLNAYYWEIHHGRNAGKQVIKDEENNLVLTTEFFKVSGGQNGGSWAVRLRGESLDGSKLSRISVVPYFALEGPGSLELENNDDEEEGIEGEIRLEGQTPSLGSFSVRVDPTPAGPRKPIQHRGQSGPELASDFGSKLDRTQFLGASVPSDQVWRARDIVSRPLIANTQSLLDKYGQLPEKLPDPGVFLMFNNEIAYGSNFWAFQKTYEITENGSGDGVWEMDIWYEAEDAKIGLDTKSLDVALKASTQAYIDRFSHLLPISSKPEFSSSPSSLSSYSRFAREMVSSTVGGIGYFHGSSIVDREFREAWDRESQASSLDVDNDDDDDGQRGSKGGDEDEEDEENIWGKKEKKPRLTEERELLTATPSRPFFPRGFYWDEGFHLLIVGAWDNDLSLEILKDWVDLIDEDGWVAREQILGEEARSKVPPEFQTQIPIYANPPTLTMAVTAYISRLRQSGIISGGEEFDPTSVGGSPGGIGNAATEPSDSLANQHLRSPSLALNFLSSIYPKLKLHYNWFRKTQKGQLKEWGRKPKSSRSEAYRWRGRTEDHVLTSGMDDYPRAKPPSLGELHLDLICWMGFFTKTMREIAEFLVALDNGDDSGKLKELGLEGVEDDVAEFEEIYDGIVGNLDELHWNEEEKMYCDVSVDEDDDSYHVCHRGYLSLFPLLLSLIAPNSTHVGHILDIISDPEHLWSPYGLRSLSKSHELFGMGENYWRGPIWIPINFMVLKSLHETYARQPGPYQERASQIYKDLRKNVINNVYKEWERTGYTWEQYNAVTGEGQRSRPFTGWTALVALIMAEMY